MHPFRIYNRNFVNQSYFEIPEYCFAFKVLFVIFVGKSRSYPSTLKVHNTYIIYDIIIIYGILSLKMFKR
jgi:hypothetical protein